MGGWSAPVETTRDAPSVTILHISDTQFGEHHRFEADSLAGHLIRDLSQLADLGVPAIDLAVLSGDIAEKGQKGEYQQALEFIEAILSHTGIGPDRVVLAPGNHDVNWALSEGYFADCRGDETEPRAPYARKWRHYQNFVAQLHEPAAFTETVPAIIMARAVVKVT
jgi:3',5'-cyclic AMP phosphodiesterase CpdA